MEDDNRDEAAAEAIRAAAERDDSEQDLQRLLEATRLENHDLPELPEPLRFTPSPIQESQAQPRHPTLTVEGQHRVDPLDQYDLLGRWPYPLPLYLLEPRGVGSQPNPFAGSSKTIGLGLPLLNRVLPVLAHTLSGIFHAPRRAVEMVLQVVSATIRHGERMMYRRARTWYLQQHPQADEAVLRDFDDTLDPDRKPPAADGTLHKSLRQLGVDDTLILAQLFKPYFKNAMHPSVTPSILLAVHPISSVPPSQSSQSTIVSSTPPSPPDDENCQHIESSSETLVAV
ncbi:MAG: hypothetical protein TREMPRED_005903 [Tremellales sp. Tagirdzhanova-0007]|nr:MAG: hypothetical protein TREMPRED_005903 [Tremellales sp. Tagirdzhanova-0007]